MVGGCGIHPQMVRAMSSGGAGACASASAGASAIPSGLRLRCCTRREVSSSPRGSGASRLIEMAPVSQCVLGRFIRFPDRRGEATA